MPCQQDAELQKYGIVLDNFALDSPLYFLTHAHFDHMIGLKKHFPKNRPRSKIYATRVTIELAKISIEGLEESDFKEITFGKSCEPVRGVTVYAFPSYHIDGSAMFWFEINNHHQHKSPIKRILYTGDFRFRERMRENPFLTEYKIDRLYIDDTFDDVQMPFPTYEQTFATILDLLVRLKHFSHIYLHVSILGVEPVLRDLAKHLHTKFGMTQTLRDTWRGKQIQFLLEGHLAAPGEPASLILGSHRHPLDDPSSPWIIPTCTYFLCRSSHREKTPPNHYYTFFATHSNHIENLRLKTLISPVKIFSCGDLLPQNQLTCNQ